MRDLAQNWKLLLCEGIAFIIFGTLALIMPNLFTLSVEIVVGLLFIMGGILQVIRSIQVGKELNFFTGLLCGILSILVGGLMLKNPLQGMIALTLLVAALFAVEGIARIVMAFRIKPLQSWGWILFSGILDLIMTSIICLQWPDAAMWFIGILVGVNMLVGGYALTVISLGLRNMKNQM